MSGKEMDVFERDIDSENDGQRERVRFWLTIVLGAILTGVVGALVVLLARANDNYDRSLGWQTQSMEVISQTRSVDAAIARAEAALGRFAVGLQKEDGRVYEYQWGRARQFLTQLQRNVRDNPKQMALVEQLTREMDSRGAQLGDAALSANYNQTVAAISKYYAAGKGEGLGRIDKVLSEIIANERALEPDVVIPRRRWPRSLVEVRRLLARGRWQEVALPVQDIHYNETPSLSPSPSNPDPHRFVTPAAPPGDPSRLRVFHRIRD